jgi:hypothetical protein
VDGWGQRVTAEDTRLGFNVARVRWHPAHLGIEGADLADLERGDPTEKAQVAPTKPSMRLWRSRTGSIDRLPPTKVH